MKWWLHKVGATQKKLDTDLGGTCRHFVNGYCSWGDKCRFTHELVQAVKGATEIIVRGQGAEITGEIQNRILEFSRKQGLARVSDVWKRMRELSSVT